MKTVTYSNHITLEPHDNERLVSLCGQCNEHLYIIEERLGVHVTHRGNKFYVSGACEHVEHAIKVISTLYDQTERNKTILPQDVHLTLQSLNCNQSTVKNIGIRTKTIEVSPKSENQATYLENLNKHDINFAIGPAGTGKTYLAVAKAVTAFEHNQVTRIILTRPIVEAGERLGFLPGDVAQKVDPYLRPLYDALYEMMGFDQVTKLMEKNVIELVPLAFMRGRSLNDSFIILDEAQNTTVEQMKMFLTRIGFGSQAVITGDPSQVDLLNPKESGLVHAVEVLKDIKAIGFSYFLARDAVRHALLQNIIEAYENHDKKKR